MCCTYSEGWNEKFCAGVPIDSGIPRISWSFDSLTLVTGSAIGVGLEHAGEEEDTATESRQGSSKSASISLKEETRNLHNECERFQHEYQDAPQTTASAVLQIIVRDSDQN
ncbi:hypothetical protein MRB53_041046 [Persea americana]|nr:hypothetical protein MRB53_041046 [Persea americana]